MKIGITGNYGCGKSTVTKIFEQEFSFKAIYADEIAHPLYLPEKPAYGRIIEIFGEEILKPDRSIDRKRFSDKAFSDENLLRKVNEIMWPEMRAEIEKKLLYSGSRTALEAAVLFEAGWNYLVDKVILVYADEEVLLRRIKDSGRDIEKAKKILKAQMPQEKKRELSDYVIDNSHSIEKTREQVYEIWNKI